MTVQHISISPDLTFDVLVAGEDGAPPVLLLHGFAESMHCWRAQLASLADMGYRAIAPSQRGYSTGARPDPRDPSRYHMDRLIDDALALVAACGCEGQRFHLAGHDWGGSIAWALADLHPDRLASLTVLSRPHPNAFNRALLLPDGDQLRRSRHHSAFLERDAADKVLADDCKWLRQRLAAAGVPGFAIEQHLAVSATRMRWKPRSPGTARAARSAHRWDQRGCRRFTSGAMPMTPSAAPRPKAPSISSPRPTALSSWRTSATSPPSRRRSASAS
jgi:pimeloyl-ACP methyl ester carboxylesterase